LDKINLKRSYHNSRPSKILFQQLQLLRVMNCSRIGLFTRCLIVNIKTIRVTLLHLNHKKNKRGVITSRTQAVLCNLSYQVLKSKYSKFRLFQFLLPLHLIQLYKEFNIHSLIHQLWIITLSVYLPSQELINQVHLVFSIVNNFQ
jgi:hypothetical protein